VKDLAIVGRIRRAHGIKGELVVELLTDTPDILFAPGRRVFAGTTDGALWRDAETGETRELTVAGSRDFKEGILLSLEEIADRTEAEHWVGRFLLAPFSELEPPAEGEVYLHELDGMRVVDATGAAVGEVSAWYKLPQGILLDLRTPRGELSVPFGEPFVLGVDRAARTITVAIPDELFPGSP
jgi:16S rRNA processing protein RimM